LVAFIATLVVGFAGVGAVLIYSRKRPVGAPLSWGEAMAAAVFTFFMFLWWYGIIPHQWLTYAGSELRWTSDRLLIRPTGVQPVTVTYQTVRDLIAVLIYGVGIALQVGMWAMWNDRGKKAPAPVPASRYGRPLVRKG
jgi:hypothetical protein